MRDPDPSSDGDRSDRLGSGVHASWHGARFTNPVRLDQVDSTNRYLRDAALQGAPEGLVVIAEEQLAGRGRRDRSWIAPRGSSLLCSILFRPAFAPADWHLLPSIVGIAAVDTLAVLAGVEASLKWPNDVLVGDAKLAGILAEIVGTPPAVVVGIGMNVAWPKGWPPPGPLAVVAERATTVERAASRAVDREEICAAFLGSIERRYAALATADGRARAAADYRSACVTIGRKVRVLLDSSTVEGRAVDVGDDGRLVLELVGGGRQSFDAGDVVHLR
ncbi:MAG: biotin/acetyl-CoA-carboxylase ligase [Acidimicrobiaceae bacterium]|nr:biotin/acetyl-CoA-carboxylase ligase [Acidimicrobiaceae bacterium]